jgi:hypothetical protein
LDCKPNELLQEVLERGLFPNIAIALRTFVSLPASVASGERTFNVLEQVRDCYWTKIGWFRHAQYQHDLGRKPDFFPQINALSKKRARKAFVK